MRKKTILYAFVMIAFVFYSLGNLNEAPYKQSANNFSSNHAFTIDSRKLDANNISK